MARNRTSGAWTIANELRGRTLRDLVSLEVSLELRCDQCGRIAVFPHVWMRRERRLQQFMARHIGELADKLRCENCESRNFHIRPYQPPQSWDHIRHAH